MELQLVDSIYYGNPFSTCIHTQIFDSNDSWYYFQYLLFLSACVWHLSPPIHEMYFFYREFSCPMVFKACGAINPWPILCWVVRLNQQSSDNLPKRLMNGLRVYYDLKKVHHVSNMCYRKCNTYLTQLQLSCPKV